jgi:general secretion pathway protein A
MYQRFYGLRELPFELTSDPRYLYYTSGHREALSNLQYGLSEAKAVTVLIGEAGTGKTTLLRAAVESEPCRNVQCIYVNNPALTRGEFIQSLARWFGLGSDAATSKSTLLEELERLLRDRIARGVTMALVVDEAQSLSPKILEEVRLLANIETPTRKLLPLVLAGQPEMSARLNEPGLRQLKQRVALRCEISPFNVDETAAYVASRIRTAGGNAAKLFSREAVMLVHEYSRGIARTVNVLCDNALLNGMALGRQLVGRDIVLDVIKDFDLRGVSTIAHGVQSAQAPPAPAPVSAPVPAPVPAPALTPRQDAISGERDHRPALWRDGGNRPPLYLEDLDSQLADPAVPSNEDPPSPPPAEPRSRFRLFGGARR